MANNGGDKNPAIVHVHLLLPVSNNRGKGGQGNMTLANHFTNMNPAIPLDCKGTTPGVGAFVGIVKENNK